MSNTELWDKVKRVPEEHLKGFTRGGGFKGTAIRPMWSIHTMTEQFGPCGKGWGIDKPEFSTHPVGNEILVFCTVAVWAVNPAAKFYGVGGDKVLAVFSSGPKADDEAFKKAFTDAVTNALKFLGVGADIHMGLWDGNKYADESNGKDRAGGHSIDKVVVRNPKSDMAHITGTPGASKAKFRDASQEIIATLHNAETVEQCKEWLILNKSGLNALPAGWIVHIEERYEEHKTLCQGGIAA